MTMRADRGLLGRTFGLLGIGFVLGGCVDQSAGDVGSSQNGSAPSISGTPLTHIAADAQYDFKPASTAAAGGGLVFSIEHKPIWANFNYVTGELWGTPSSTDVGEYGDIVISASDGRIWTALPSFAIIVTSSTVASTSSPAHSSNPLTGSSRSGSGDSNTGSGSSGSTDSSADSGSSSSDSSS